VTVIDLAMDVRVGHDMLLGELALAPWRWTGRPRQLGALTDVLEDAVDHSLSAGRDERNESQSATPLGLHVIEVLRFDDVTCL
jgi:hypothetical protein